MRKQMTRHRRELSRIASVAESRALRGRYGAATAYLQIAVELAARDHPGAFASPRLERVAAIVADRVLEPWPAKGRPASIGRVLHVLTTPDASTATSIVRAWMKCDGTRSHDVVLTGRAADGAQELRSFVHSRGGVVHDLGDVAPVVERARRLRSLAAEYDLVVLCSQSDDVTGALACSGRDDDRGPRVVVLNVADDAFWLGTGAADLVVSLRPSAQHLVVRRRGVPVHRAHILPVPMAGPDRQMSRADARRALGLPTAGVVLFTAGGGSRYVGAAMPDLQELVFPVLRTHPEAVLVVEGARMSGRWEELSIRTAGRVLTTAPATDVSLHHQAADVYLDSYPLTSVLPCLQAALLGNPVVSYTTHRGEGAVLAIDDVALDRHLVSARSVSEFRSMLTDLIEDDAGRRQIGSLTEQAMREAHVGPGWSSALEGLYERVLAVPTAALPSEDAIYGEPGVLDDQLVQWALAKQTTVPLSSLLWAHRRRLALLDRTGALALGAAARVRVLPGARRDMTTT
jgi:hypothetical protein